MTRFHGPHLAALLILIFGLSACTSAPLDQPGRELEIGRIVIDPAAAHGEGSPAVISRCSGFILSEKEVHNFLANAERFRMDGTEKKTLTLPCFATGTAVLNGRRYNWTIHAGGMGEVKAGKDQFQLICGKNCCPKVPGIC